MITTIILLIRLAARYCPYISDITAKIWPPDGASPYLNFLPTTTKLCPSHLQMIFSEPFSSLFED